jgi:uncharacterized RDD family membrane protein YckC
MKPSTTVVSKSLTKTLATTLPSAHWRKRFLAMMYEAVILFGVFFLADYLFDSLTQSKHALMLRHTRQLWLFTVVGCYFVWFWRHGGQTLPMKTWHIRLVSSNGEPMLLWRLWLRYVLSWLWVLPACGFAFLMKHVFDVSLAWFFLWLMLNIAVLLWCLSRSKDGQLFFDRWLKCRVVFIDPKQNK